MIWNSPIDRQPPSGAAEIIAMLSMKQYRALLVCGAERWSTTESGSEVFIRLPAAQWRAVSELDATMAIRHKLDALLAVSSRELCL